MAQKQERPYLTVSIVSPSGVVYQHRSYSCSVRTLDGGLTILPNHIPILAALDISAVKVQRLEEGNPVDYIAINGGILSMRDNQLEIISNYAVRARDIDAVKVEIERQKAEEDMQKALQEHNKREFERAKIALQRAINQISVSQHRRI